MKFSAALLPFLSAAALCAQQAPPAADDAVARVPPVTAVTIHSGVPLHVRIDRRVALADGYAVVGTLTEAIYVDDRMALPAGTKMRGTIVSLEPLRGMVRAQALLNGDVTPLHTPVVTFVAAQMPNGTAITIAATGRIRETQMVRFTPAGKKPSLIAQGKAIVRERIESARAAIFAPGKSDRVLRLLYGQLPYHPQRLWAGSQIIADLDTPAIVPVQPAPPAMRSSDLTRLDGIDVTARLVTALDSRTAHKGDAVTGIVTVPVFAADHTLLLPEGAELHGIVLSTKAARSLGRNGALHFGIRGVDVAGGAAQHVDGTLAGAEGTKDQNVTVDREGNVKSNPDKGRFLAPALLIALAASGQDHDHDHHGDGGSGGAGAGGGNEVVASNGFGLIARVISLASNNGNVATGFGAYGAAKSVYFRFLTRGHEVTFAKDTLVTVRLAVR